MKKQRTIKVAGRKIKIVSAQRTHFKNPLGFYVWINGCKTWEYTLTREEAEQNAFAKWVNTQPDIETIF